MIDKIMKKAKEYSLGSKNVLQSHHKSFFIYKKYSKIDIRCAFYYALAYFEGRGVNKNKKKAEEIITSHIEKFEQFAEKRKVDYCLIIGDMYSFGLGYKQDFKNAFKWYYISAELGSLEAMCNLGYMYMVGQGVAVNEKLSSYWWLKSAKLGYLHSYRDIAKNYFYGKGVEQSYFKAIYWFGKASENNYVHGTTELAICYYNGLGVRKDIDKAKTLFLKAIKQDLERAVRDIISNGFDLNRLVNENILINNKIKSININTINNFIYKNILFIGKDINYIDYQSFYNFTNLQKIIVESDNENYTTINGVLFSKDKKTILKYPIGKKDEHFVIPDSVQVIGNYCFQNAKNILQVTINSDIKKIGKGAFDDCKKLTEINIPNSVQLIGDWCFHGCDNLKEIILPNELLNIGHYSLGSCERLNNIEISDENLYYKTISGNLYNVDLSIFIQYSIGSKIKKFKLPKTVKVILFRAFSDAYRIEKIEINSKVTIHEKAFAYCINLTEIYFSVIPEIKSNNIFHKTSSFLVLRVKPSIKNEFKKYLKSIKLGVELL